MRYPLFSLLLIAAVCVAIVPAMAKAEDPAYGLSPAKAKQAEYGLEAEAGNPLRELDAPAEGRPADPFPIKLASKKPAGVVCDPLTGRCTLAPGASCDCEVCDCNPCLCRAGRCSPQSTGQQCTAGASQYRGSGAVGRVLEARPLRTVARKVVGFRPFKRWREARQQSGGGFLARRSCRSCG